MGTYNLAYTYGRAQRLSCSQGSGKNLRSLSSRRVEVGAEAWFTRPSNLEIQYQGSDMLV